jgi:hypothetical protein
MIWQKCVSTATAIRHQRFLVDPQPRQSAVILVAYFVKGFVQQQRLNTCQWPAPDPHFLDGASTASGGNLIHLHQQGSRNRKLMHSKYPS